MSSVVRLAGAAGSITLHTKNASGNLITPVSTPTVTWYTDPARTLGALVLPVTGSGSSWTASWTAAQAPAGDGDRYLRVRMEVSAGVFTEDVDDSITFRSAVSSPAEADAWITVADLMCDVPTPVPASYTNATVVASAILAALSGYRVGTRSVVARPMPMCGCSRYDRARPGDSCGRSNEWPLSGPVVTVTEVKVDGAVVPASAYELVGSVLVRTDDENWPSCMNVTTPWSVSYVQGTAPDASAKAAAAALACELARGWEGAECRLPQRVTTITRQGVTVALTDPMDLFHKGRTGIGEVDLWLGVVNPNGLRRPGGISYPGAKTTRRSA